MKSFVAYFLLREDRSSVPTRKRSKVHGSDKLDLSLMKVIDKLLLPKSMASTRIYTVDCEVPVELQHILLLKDMDNPLWLFKRNQYTFSGQIC
jgi:hypothetical protein